MGEYEMPVTYASPGVYVEEVDRGTKPVEAVGTSTAAFIGITAEASEKYIDTITNQRRTILPAALLNKPILVTNWRQYTDYFGEFVDGAYMPDAVYGYFANGGGPCYIVSLRALNELSEKEIPFATVEIPAANGRGKSFTLRAIRPGPTGNTISVTVKNDPEVEGTPPTFTLIVDGEARAGLTMKKGENSVADVVFNSVEILDVGTSPPAEGDYILSGGGIQPLETTDFAGDPTKRTGLGGLEALDDVRLVLCPDIMAGYEDNPEARERVKATQAVIIAHCERLRYRFAILDTPPGLNAQKAQEWRKEIGFDSSYAALYYPWIRVADLSGASRSKLVPPSGHVVGIYNRTDSDRGVHKAPANEVLRLAIDVETNLSKEEQGTLNPIGVNCIRSFPMRGIRVWGGRTLSSDPSWRYINVRRLFILVGASLEAGMQWVVFEPNDSTLWAKVRRDSVAFLRTIWRTGALFGTTPDMAFYVKCDEELNPSEIRDLGQLIIEIGLAPVKPAEFVIFRISQWAGPNAEQ
jgi:phage tail sheath protein FI